MRTASVLIALVLAAPVSGAPPSAPALDREPLLSVDNAPQGQPMLDHMPLRQLNGQRICRDRIMDVRDERGLPRLDRDARAGEDALLIAAVDKRIDGCSVMVMRNDTGDNRPIPTEEGPARLQPLPGQ